MHSQPASPTAPRIDAASVLAVTGLSVELVGPSRVLPIVEDLAFEIGPGEFFALVGESGSGKSITCLALMNLLTKSYRMRGQAFLGEQPLIGGGIDHRTARANMAMIFQNPVQYLNPVRSIGFQLTEVVRRAAGQTRGSARRTARQLLAEVGLADPDWALSRYPHQLSGGMNQRVMIAQALAARPALLIADEPTSSLDVTMQVQILDLIDRLRRDHAMSVLFVTHDLSVAAERADRVGVLYAGHLVEQGPARSVLGKPRHRYTAGLVGSLPRFDRLDGRLPTLDGNVPLPGARPPGCRFAPRCAGATEACRTALPALRGSPDHRYACHHPVDWAA